VGCGLADCCQLKESTNQNVDIAGMVKPVFKQYDASQEIIFPPALINYAKDTSDQGIRRRLEFNGKRTTWHRPANVDEVLALKVSTLNTMFIHCNKLESLMIITELA
jgi:xanthine dehydrogenase/oxidase